MAEHGYYFGKGWSISSHGKCNGYVKATGHMACSSCKLMKSFHQLSPDDNKNSSMFSSVQSFFCSIRNFRVILSYINVFPEDCEQRAVKLIPDMLKTGRVVISQAQLKDMEQLEDAFTSLTSFVGNPGHSSSSSASSMSSTNILR